MENDFVGLMKEQMEKLISEGRKESELTPWVVFTSLLSDKSKISVMALMADMEIIKLLASGISPRSIATMLGIESKSVFSVSLTWGLTPVELTLDFNPLLVYNSGMDTPEMMMQHVNDVLFQRLSLQQARVLIGNVERYAFLLRYLEEVNDES